MNNIDPEIQQELINYFIKYDIEFEEQQDQITGQTTYIAKLERMNPKKLDRSKLKPEPKQLIEQAQLFRKLNYNRYKPILFYWKNNKDYRVDDLVVNENKEELVSNFDSFINKMCNLQLQNLYNKTTFEIFGMITSNSQELIDFLYYIQLNTFIYGFASLISAFAEQQTRSETVMIPFISLLKYFVANISTFQSCSYFLESLVDIEEQQNLISQFFSPLYQREIEKQIYQKQVGSMYASNTQQINVYRPQSGDQLFKFMFNFYSNYGKKCRNNNYTQSMLRQFLRESMRQSFIDRQSFIEIYERVVRTIFKDCYKKVGLKFQQQQELLDKTQQILDTFNTLIKSQNLQELLKQQVIKNRLGYQKGEEQDIRIFIENFKEKLSKCQQDEDLYNCLEQFIKSKYILGQIIKYAQKLKSQQHI